MSSVCNVGRLVLLIFTWHAFPLDSHCCNPDTDHTSFTQWLRGEDRRGMDNAGPACREVPQRIMATWERPYQILVLSGANWGKGWVPGDASERYMWAVHDAHWGPEGV